MARVEAGVWILEHYLQAPADRPDAPDGARWQVLRSELEDARVRHVQARDCTQNC